MIDLLAIADLVLPTRVGVDRVQLVNAPPLISSPHTRGGGPDHQCLKLSLPTFSPHAWGWTGTCCHLCQNGIRSPHTRGGGPHRKPPKATGTRSPHTRGGGPAADGEIKAWPRSPHTRGGGPWYCPDACGGARSPHTRGGGPSSIRAPTSPTMFSPHAWGWTAYLNVGRFWGCVLPTRVGVDRCRGSYVA